MMTKTLETLKREYIIRFIIGVVLFMSIGVLLLWLYTFGKWWSWILILLIGPSAFVYALRQIPSEIRALKYVLASKNVDEFIIRDKMIAELRDIKARKAAREKFKALNGD